MPEPFLMDQPLARYIETFPYWEPYKELEWLIAQHPSCASSDRALPASKWGRVPRCWIVLTMMYRWGTGHEPEPHCLVLSRLVRVPTSQI